MKSINEIKERIKILKQSEAGLKEKANHAYITNDDREFYLAGAYEHEICRSELEWVLKEL